MKNKVTIRPNLNTYDQCTIHDNRLGSKADSVYTVTIQCIDTVIRKGGQKLAEKHGKKTVHAGLIGYIVPTIKVNTKIHPRVRYAPHKGDKFFTVHGVEYKGGGLVTCLGHKYYLVSKI